MMKKKWTTLILMFALMLPSVAVFAQVRNRPEGWRYQPDILRELALIVRETTGLTQSEIREQLQEDGATIRTVLEANGVDIASVIQTAIEQITEKVNEAVENERINQDQADRILDNLEAHITEFISVENLLRDHGRGPRQNRDVRRLVAAVAEETGLEPQDVISQLADGEKTLASILVENGVDVQSFVDNFVSNRRESLREDVEAGRISQEVADARLNLFKVELEFALDRTRR